jgi:hypothetical protein
MTKLDIVISDLAANDRRRPPRQPAQIFNWLWLGDQNNAFNAQDSGFTHIISCMNQNEMNLIRGFWKMREYQPHQLHICVEDQPTTNITSWFPVVWKWLSNLALKSTDKVLIHCQAGVNRSASLALMIYCHTTNTKPGMAGKLFWVQRPGILTNREFRLQIDEWWGEKNKT